MVMSGIGCSSGWFVGPLARREVERLVDVERPDPVPAGEVRDVVAIDSTVRPWYGSMCAATSTPRLFAARRSPACAGPPASPSPTTTPRSRRSLLRGSRSSVHRSRACRTTNTGRSPGSTTRRCRSAARDRPATSAGTSRQPPTCRTTGSRTRTRGRPRPHWRARRAQPVGRVGTAALRGVRLRIIYHPGATDNGPSGPSFSTRTR